MFCGYLQNQRQNIETLGLMNLLFATTGESSFFLDL